MTGVSTSTLSRYADVVLDISVDREACTNNLAPTSSTTVTLVLGDALAIVASKQRGFQPEDFARFHPGGNLGRKLLTKVADVMRVDNIPICSLDASFEDIGRIINQGKLGLAIVTSGGIVMGIITDGDMRRALANYTDVSTLVSRDFMTTNPEIVQPHERFMEAETRMRLGKINSLIVADQDRQLIGVLQIFDADVN